MDTGEVRDLLHDFAALMRADEKQAIPRGEPNLASPLALPSAGEGDASTDSSGRSAGGTTGCSPTSASSPRPSSDRVLALEAEVQRLRAKLGDDG